MIQLLRVRETVGGTAWRADEQYLDTQCFVLYSLHKSPHNREGHGSFKQGSSNLTHRCFDIVFVELAVDFDDVPSLLHA